MVKLPPLKPREVVRILQRIGFHYVRQHGSHLILFKDLRGMAVIPMHRHDLKKGLLLSIIEKSGLSLEEFLSLR